MDEAAARLESVSSKCSRLIKERRISQTELARKIGMDRSTLNRMLRNHRDPKPHEIDWIARALGYSREEFLEGVELPPRARGALERTEANEKRLRLLEEILLDLIQSGELPEHLQERVQEALDDEEPSMSA
jgi:transcriptional regulator with XRE-family HTH domain